MTAAAVIVDDDHWLDQDSICKSLTTTSDSKKTYSMVSPDNSAASMIQENGNYERRSGLKDVNSSNTSLERYETANNANKGDEDDDDNLIEMDDTEMWLIDGPCDDDMKNTVESPPIVVVLDGEDDGVFMESQGFFQQQQVENFEKQKEPALGMLSGQYHARPLLLPRLPSTIVEENAEDESISGSIPASPAPNKRNTMNKPLLFRKKSFSLNDLPSLMPDSSSSSSSLPSSNNNNNNFPINSHSELPQPDNTSSFSSLQQQQPQQQPLGSNNSFPNNAQQQYSNAQATRIHSTNETTTSNQFVPYYSVTRLFDRISRVWLKHHYGPLCYSTWIGFWALLMVTNANYVLTPMRDAIALAVGVSNIPKLTLASTVLAFGSSVPIGWLFEAPDPGRRIMFKRMGLTRGETQGSSLALFYRCFALILLSYAIGFPLLEWLKSNHQRVLVQRVTFSTEQQQSINQHEEDMLLSLPEKTLRNLYNLFQFIASMIPDVPTLLATFGQALYIAFFLVVHLMKLHSLSLMWGVTTEAMEYEEAAREKDKSSASTTTTTTTTRLQRLALIGFGGTLGGILGSILASSLAHILYLPGLLVMAAVMLEISAELSIELGRIMQKHWEEQQQEILFASSKESSNNNNLLDTSIRRSVSLGSMKRVASGNSLNRVRSALDLQKSGNANGTTNNATPAPSSDKNGAGAAADSDANDNTFFQRLLRGLTTILRSRLLMAIFTYNALYASTTVLLSFQRAELVANRNKTSHSSSASSPSSKEADMAFLANINMASSVAIFALQATGVGASVAQACGPQGTLALMPVIRLAGVLALAWWHHSSEGKPPNLIVFLIVDECCKVMNLAVAKPVRENLWRGLSNEARYEAKPIVDTLANRWGGGSAAFLVSTLNKTLDWLRVPVSAENGSRLVFGYPPILFLGMLVASWWVVVSFDLGQIRRHIDLELKKRL